MPFTRSYSITRPAGGDQARTADDEIRYLRVDMDERLAQILGVPSIVGLDPLINGTSRLSIADLVTNIASKATINTSDGRVPKKQGAGTFIDSFIADNGTAISLLLPTAVTGALTSTSDITASGVLSGAQYYAIATSTVATTLVQNTDTLVNIDTGSGSGCTVDTSADKITTGKAGLYLLVWVCNPRTSANGNVTLKISKNGSIGSVASTLYTNNYTNTTTWQVTQFAVDLATSGTDYYQLHAQINSVSGSIQPTSVFYAVRVM